MTNWELFKSSLTACRVRPGREALWGPWKLQSKGAKLNVPEQARLKRGMRTVAEAPGSIQEPWQDAAQEQIGVGARRANPSELAAVDAPPGPAAANPKTSDRIKTCEWTIGKSVDHLQPVWEDLRQPRGSI